MPFLWSSSLRSDANHTLDRSAAQFRVGSFRPVRLSLRASLILAAGISLGLWMVAIELLIYFAG